MLIAAKVASKSELEECYTLDEALKLSSLMTMQQDIEAYHADEMRKMAKR